MTAPATYYRRAPFLLLQWEGDSLAVLNCNDLRRHRLDDRAVAVLSRLATWTPAAAVAGTDGGAGITEASLASLHRAGLVEATTSPGTGEPCPPRWDPLDLALQRRANRGGQANGSGPAPVPVPAERSRSAGEGMALPAPVRPAADLLDVVDRRRSVRRYADAPLPLVDLASLLHHSARVSGSFQAHDGTDLALHPYPSGGGRSELELYVVANAVDGLAAGAYWFDPAGHSLHAVQPAGDHQDGFNQAVHLAAGHRLTCDPPAVVVVTAVFSRILAHYRNIGLGLVYRNTGCLLQTMYLVATALGLAPCALVVPREREVAAWLGLDPLVESMVACFAVGVPEPPPTGPDGR